MFAIVCHLYIVLVIGGGGGSYLARLFVCFVFVVIGLGCFSLH